MENGCDIGLVGLAVMGENLVLNMESRGFRVGVFNRTAAVTEKFLAGPAKGRNIVGFTELKALVAGLKRPRRIMTMVKAGKAVDDVFNQLMEILEPGDVLIDGGNSHYDDSRRRHKEITARGFHYLGAGVSGGEEGALKGPSIMPGGSKEAWPLVKPIFQAIAARVGPKHDIPCCEWVGADGAGHYVKMIHNGIEYGDMQLICEAYHLLKAGAGLSNAELAKVFADWNTGVLDSYLIEITRDIFTAKDPDAAGDLVDNILDAAGQKGTGKWMSQHALDLGSPTTLITEAVFARCLSAQKDERVRAASKLAGPSLAAAPKLAGAERQAFIDGVRDALYGSKIVSYAQGFVQMREAAKEFGWDLNYGDIALLWRGGCIIRARFLERIKEAFDRNPRLENLLLDDYFRDATAGIQNAWRKTVAAAVTLGIPAPGFSTALAYYDGYRCDRLPANLLQAQRDYFGAHTFERLDQPRGKFHHAEWLDLRKPIG
jgi:6-phosphogluconate dehydrogenase